MTPNDLLIMYFFFGVPIAFATAINAPPPFTRICKSAEQVSGEACVALMILLTVFWPLLLGIWIAIACWWLLHHIIVIHKPFLFLLRGFRDLSRIIRPPVTEPVPLPTARVIEKNK